MPGETSHEPLACPASAAHLSPCPRLSPCAAPLPLPLTSPPAPHLPLTPPPGSLAQAGAAVLPRHAAAGGAARHADGQLSDQRLRQGGRRRACLPRRSLDGAPRTHADRRHVQLAGRPSPDPLTSTLTPTLTPTANPHPDPHTDGSPTRCRYNSLMDACVRSGNLTRAHEALGQLRAAGLQPNVRPRPRPRPRPSPLALAPRPRPRPPLLSPPPIPTPTPTFVLDPAPRPRSSCPAGAHLLDHDPRLRARRAGR